MPTNCEQIKSFLYDRVLEGAPNAELDAHLATCQACQAELAELALTHKLMRQGLPEEEPARRIVFAADPLTVASPGFGLNALRFWQWSFAGAAAFAVLFAALFAGVAVRRPAAAPAAAQVVVPAASAAVRPGGNVPVATAAVAPGGNAPATVAVTPASTFTRAEVEQIVNKAVAASEERQKMEMASVIHSAAERMSDQLHYLQSSQTQVYRQTEQNRADIRQVTALVGVRQ